jgi:hypothetical protein
MRTVTAQRAILAAIALLALIVLSLLLRNALAIPAHVPLDPNEGWNAAHAMAAQLYPPSGSLMVNNYPPLSFYLVRAVTPLTGDAIVAGRIIAMAAFLLVCAGIAAALRTMGTDRRGAALAAVFFAATLLVASDYVGMDDPQLLGHAVQIAALLILLRGQVMAAAVLFTASLFVKHNLLALPLAAGLWLCLADRRAGLRFITTGLVACGLGLVLFRLAWGTSLLAQLASPRLSSFTNLQTAAAHLWWAPLPVIATFGVAQGRWRNLCLIYAALATLLGVVFSAGDGVDANAFFDLAIALSLALGLTRWTVPAAAAALPLAAMLALSFSDNNFFFTRAFAVQSARDIAFLRARPGPALCDQLSLCLWAGKSATVDVFNIGEAFLTGARDPAPLVAQIEAHHFTTLQLEDLDALGPQIRAAIARNYRANHTDDNGTFFIPARQSIASLTLRQAQGEEFLMLSPSKHGGGSHGRYTRAFTVPWRSSLPQPTNGPFSAVHSERTTT